MKKRIKKEEKRKKVSIDIPVSLMRNAVAYLFSEHRTRSFIKKLHMFFMSVDENVFLQDPDLEVYYLIITSFTRLYIENNLENNEIIIQNIVSSPRLSEEIEEKLMDADDIEIRDTDAIFIENEFIDRLNYISTIPIISTLKNAISRFDKNDFDNFNAIIDEIRTETTSFNRVLNVRSASSLTFPEVNFNSNSFMGILEKVYANLKSPTRSVKTGIKRLNTMLHGGWQPSRVYVLNAVTGGFKSGLLLNILLWAAKYNHGIKCRDQSKKPMFLYLSQSGSYVK